MLSPNWDAIGTIGQVVGALATTAAVIVTLFLAYSSKKKKNKLQFQDDLGEVNDIHFAGVRATNIGQCLIELACWGFLTDSNFCYHFSPDPMTIKLQKERLPRTLSPNTSFRLFVKQTDLYNAVFECYESKDFKDLHKPLYIFVEDTSGQQFIVKTDLRVGQYLENSKRKQK